MRYREYAPGNWVWVIYGRKLCMMSISGKPKTVIDDIGVLTLFQFAQMIQRNKLSLQFLKDVRDTEADIYHV